MPGSVVAPPVETPAVYGLFSAARLLPLTGHEQLGIQYEALCDRPSDRVWPGACRPLRPGPDVTRTITVTLAGARTGTSPNFTYTVTAIAGVDSGPHRELSVVVNGGAPVTITTGTAAPTEIHSSATADVLNLTVTDTATATDETWTVTQNADGTLTATSDAFTVTEPGELTKLVGAGTSPVQAPPFAVYGVEDCALGLTHDELANRARQRLANTEQPAVEHVFWTGEFSDGPALATSTPTVLNSGDPTSLVDAVGRLEEWLGQAAGVVGFLHTSRVAAAHASHLAIASRASNRLETSIGNVFVFGGGYPRTGPTGTAAPPAGGTQLWMFATRQPTVRRSEVFVPAEPQSGSFSFARNKNVIVAERVYVVDFPCQTAAVLVDLSLCPCGGTP